MRRCRSGSNSCRPRCRWCRPRRSKFLKISATPGWTRATVSWRRSRASRGSWRCLTKARSRRSRLRRSWIRRSSTDWIRFPRRWPRRRLRRLLLLLPVRHSLLRQDLQHQCRARRAHHRHRLHRHRLSRLSLRPRRARANKMLKKAASGLVKREAYLVKRQLSFSPRFTNTRYERRIRTWNPDTPRARPSGWIRGFSRWISWDRPGIPAGP